MKNHQFWYRSSGIAGIFGGIILLSGDMLFYYTPDSLDLSQNMGNASDIRIITSAVAALWATWFYVLGLGQVYYAFKPARASVRNTVLISFGSILIAYGIIHGAYTAIATSAKLATEHHLDINTAVSLALETNNTMRLFIYPFFAVLSVVFIYQVWKGKTLYPKWIILFFPLIPFLLKPLFCKIVPARLWIFICGGFFNLILIVFFAASTVALWKNINPVQAKS